VNPAAWSFRIRSYHQQALNPAAGEVRKQDRKLQ
jgi:hypothetical protein